MIDKLKVLSGAAILGHIAGCIIAAIWLGIDIHNTKWDTFSCLVGAIFVYGYFEKRGWGGSDEENRLADPITDDDSTRS